MSENSTHTISQYPIASAKAQFDRQAQHYNNQWASWSDESLQRMIEVANPQPDWRVLDVATGTGYTALAFAPLVAEVVGVDISEGMLAQARKNAETQGIENVKWEEAPAEQLPFPEATFTAVTCRIAPHHFNSISQFLSETYRVLQPGGLLLIGDTTVPDDQPEAGEWQNLVEWERDNSHVKNLSPTEWRAATEGIGFRVLGVEYQPQAISIPLSKWLETSGTTGEQADRVRALFANAPDSARTTFAIQTDLQTGETTFAWARVLLHAQKP